MRHTFLTFMIACGLCASAQTITNPSFENGKNGWEIVDMQLQGNDVFNIKAGNTYIEKWTEKGGAVGNACALQTVKNLQVGIYTLSAAAQNIQENYPSANQTGAWIVGNNERTAVSTRKTYSVTFAVLTGEACIGFVAEKASGNWIACDNFTLQFEGSQIETLKAELLKHIEAGEALLNKKMQTATQKMLAKAIDDARYVYSNDNDATNIPTVAIALQTATKNATLSVNAYAALLTAIDDAVKDYGEGTGVKAEDYLAAIESAKKAYDNLSSSVETLNKHVQLLKDASLLYKINNSTGAVPKVKTDRRYAKGCIEAFGRSTVTGVTASKILEQGFVYSETNPEPTVLDQKSTDYIEYNGKIYRMPMKPGTLYYVRAYAMTTGYAVGYGEVMRISTLPQGHVTWTYDYATNDVAQNNRVEKALIDATTWWTNYTSIRGFNVDAHFSPGTPTADCGYGGYMRIGTNMGQREGTVMHEMNHGVGCGTLDMWGGWAVSPFRQEINGDWCGDRANEALRFWENNDNLWVCGAYDGAHWGIHNKGQAYDDGSGSTALWMNMYPNNGAHLEPGAWAGPTDWNGTQHKYIGNSIITQGFMEDGLVPVNYYGGGFCLPAYVFEHQDEVKYYLTNENDNRGSLKAFLTETETGTVKWIAHESIAENDSAAWYVSFNAEKQYYSFRNAATGHLLSYSASGTNGIKAANKQSISTNEEFHLMQRRNADAEKAKDTKRGYWIIQPSGKNCLAAMVNGTTSSSALNLYDKASAQRWIIVTAEEAEEMSQGEAAKARDMLAQLVGNLRNLQKTPCEENDGTGAKETFAQAIDKAQQCVDTETDAETLTSMYAETRKAGMCYLAAVTPTDIEQPFDLTFMLSNPSLKDNGNGWSEDAVHNFGSCEFYETTFDFNQTLTDMPKGNYELHAQAFQRKGDAESAYEAYITGRVFINALLYVNTKTKRIRNIADEAQEFRLGGDELAVGNPTVYLPNNMESAGIYFNHGLYENSIEFSARSSSNTITLGIKGTKAESRYWTIFRNFRLYFYGTVSPTSVPDIADETTSTPAATYDLTGRAVSAPQRGIYIKNGKKFLSF